MTDSLKTVLVTGGAGYIGSHVCKALAHAGYTPVTFDNLRAGHRWAVKWGPLVVGDLVNKRDIQVAFDTYEPFAVMHLAGSISVRESVEDPSNHYRNNIVGAYNLLEVMRAKKVRQLVFSSSCTVYGRPQFLPLTEQHPVAPISPYGRTKWMVEEILTDYATSYGSNSIALRFFNAAGADPDSEIGEARAAETHLIPLMLDSVLSGKNSVTVNGDDFDTPDGTCIRDYVHVVDIAQAHIRALDALSKDVGAKVFNLGNGQGYSVLEVIEAVQKCTSTQFRIETGPRRRGDPAKLVGDCSNAKEILGWVPEHSALHEITESAWAWKQSYKAGKD